MDLGAAQPYSILFIGSYEWDLLKAVPAGTISCAASLYSMVVSMEACPASAVCFQGGPLAGEIGKQEWRNQCGETSGLFMSAVSHFLTIWYRAWRPIRRDGFLRFPKMADLETSRSVLHIR